MEATGERFLPGGDSGQIAYEHYQRYLFARAAVRGRRVLDLASGEGYGSWLLARDAALVVGLDRDPAAVRHAASKYFAPNLRFVAAEGTRIPVGDGQVDVFACFETIEHLGSPEELACEARRVLGSAGLLLVSTPNRPVYSETPGLANAFHRHELDREEFEALLRRHFRHVVLYGQRLLCGASLWNLSDDPGLQRTTEIELEVVPGEPWPADEVRPFLREPLYFLALASDAPIPEALLWRTVLLNDRARLILGEVQANRVQLHAREEGAARERARLLAEVRALEAHAAGLAGQVAAARAETDLARADAARAREETEARAAEAREAREALRALEESPELAELSRLRDTLARLLPQDSRRRIAFERLVRFLR
jgi:SAM-dependent methyltransferase